MEKRWFHKEDGGLIMLDRHTSPVSSYGYAVAQCSICDERWLLTGIPRETMIIKASDKDFVQFLELSEDLQTVALSEML